MWIATRRSIEIGSRVNDEWQSRIEWEHLLLNTNLVRSVAPRGVYSQITYGDGSSDVIELSYLHLKGMINPEL